MAGKNSKSANVPKKNTSKVKSRCKRNENISDNKELDVTTRIRVDDVRLNDSDSLDTSFLEGRVEKKVKKDNNAKVKILRDDSLKLAKREKMKKIFSTVIMVLILLFLFSLLIIFIAHNKHSNIKKEKDVSVTEVEKEETSKLMDSNYLFVGDFYTNDFDFEAFDLDYHYVKVSENNLTTTDVLSDMKSMVYDYNPSRVFIELGMVDLIKGSEVDEIYDNIGQIIDLIKKNRPYAEIYVESVYPVNVDLYEGDQDITVDNSDIIKLNKKIKKVVSKNKVNYLDVYTMLENDNKLDSEFSDNGMDLNKDGYQQVLKVISKVID